MDVGHKQQGVRGAGERESVGLGLSLVFPPCSGRRPWFRGSQVPGPHQYLPKLQILARLAGPDTLLAQQLRLLVLVLVVGHLRIAPIFAG